MKTFVIVFACLLLGPWVQAASSTDSGGKAQQINMDLKKDVLDQAGDSKKIGRLREKLRKTYDGYATAVRKHGNGTPQSRQAAKKVMEAQINLHQELDMQTGGLPPLPDDQSASLPEKAVTAPVEQRKEDIPQLAPEDAQSQSFDEKVYNDIVEQFGKDSPQAAAARRHFKDLP